MKALSPQPVSQSPEGSSRHFNLKLDQLVNNPRVSQSPEGSSRHFNSGRRLKMAVSPGLSQSPEGSSRHFNYVLRPNCDQTAGVSIARRLFSSFQLFWQELSCLNPVMKSQSPEGSSRHFNGYRRNWLENLEKDVSIARRLFSSFQHVEKKLLVNKSCESQSPEGSSRHFNRKYGAQHALPGSKCLNRPKALLVISTRNR